MFIKRSWVIIHWVPGYKKEFIAPSVLQKTRKNLTIHYWQEESQKKLETPLVLFKDKEENIKLAASTWVAFLYEERMFDTKIKVETVALSEQELFISFDQPLFARSWSIHKKWQMLDSFTKTVQNLEPDIKKVMFLVKNECMQDDHFDFSRPWHIDR